ncbi:MAG: DUF4349 domain-containing protein [Bacteroidales bacterium]
MRKITPYILLFALLAFSCGSGSKPDKSSGTMNAADISKVKQGESPSYSSGGNANQPEPASGQQRQQLLIKTVRMGIEVTDYNVARNRLDTIINKHKAWISNENMQSTSRRITNTITIRIPSDKLDKFTQRITSIARTIDYQNTETADVTEEYIDIKSHLSNQETLEQRFISLLKSTNSMDEILKIETKLAEVRSNIESLEGRVRYLNNRVSYSTIHVEMYQEINYTYTHKPVDSLGQRFKKSILGGWNGLVYFILFLFRIWPIWTVGIIAGLIALRINKKKEKDNN